MGFAPAGTSIFSIGPAGTGGADRAGFSFSCGMAGGGGTSAVLTLCPQLLRSAAPSARRGSRRAAVRSLHRRLEDAEFKISYAVLRDSPRTWKACPPLFASLSRNDPAPRAPGLIIIVRAPARVNWLYVEVGPRPFMKSRAASFSRLIRTRGFPGIQGNPSWFSPIAGQARVKITCWHFRAGGFNVHNVSEICVANDHWVDGNTAGRSRVWAGTGSAANPDSFQSHRTSPDASSNRGY